MRASHARLPWEFHFFAFTTFTEATAKRLFFAWKIEVKTMDARHRFTNDVKSCPKESRYKLTHCDLQRFQWRLWKRKDENPCYARARKDQNEGGVSFLYTSPSALPSTLFCHLPKRPKRGCPQRENYVGDFPKNVGLFSKKLPRFFVFLLRFSNSLGEKMMLHVS